VADPACAEGRLSVLPAAGSPAPRFTDLAGASIDAARRCQQKIRTARLDVVTMRVGGTRFRFRLEGGHQQAHQVYRHLAEEGKTYEPLATACLTRLLQRLPEPTFMDIGTRVELLEWLEHSGFSVLHVAGHVWEHRSGLRTHLEQGRFAYVPVTAATRQHLLYDRPVEILILASKIPDLSELLGPPVDLAAAVG